MKIEFIVKKRSCPLAKLDRYTPVLAPVGWRERNTAKLDKKVCSVPICIFDGPYFRGLESTKSTTATRASIPSQSTTHAFFLGYYSNKNYLWQSQL